MDTLQHHKYTINNAIVYAFNYFKFACFRLLVFNFHFRTLVLSILFLLSCSQIKKVKRKKVENRWSGTNMLMTLVAIYAGFSTITVLVFDFVVFWYVVVLFEVVC